MFMTFLKYYYELRFSKGCQAAVVSSHFELPELETIVDSPQNNKEDETLIRFGKELVLDCRAWDSKFISTALRTHKKNLQ